jgi:amino acid transporter
VRSAARSGHLDPAPAGPRISPSLFFGLAVASIGGPLALAAFYFPGAAGEALPSSGLVAVLAALLYGLPLYVWVRYSEEIVSAGGLAAFVAAAAGRRLALAQAAVWTFSYFLYLPYTVTDVVYDDLAKVFPGIHPWRPVLEVALPLAIVALVLAGLAPVLWTLLVSAALQLALLLLLGAVELAHVGAPSFAHSPHAHEVARGSASVSLLFVCGSLPLFLAAEAAGGGRTLRRSLVGAGATVAAYVVFAAFPLAAVSPRLRDTDLPGYAIAGAYSGRALAVAVGLVGALSVVGLIVVEYLALSRLAFAVARVPVRRALAWIAVPFVAIDVASLAAPEEIYERLLKPSLVALFTSQVIVVLAYPRFRARLGGLGALDVVAAAGATAVFAWGLYNVLFGAGVANS